MVRKMMNPSLEDMRNDHRFISAGQPKVVYHITSKEAVNDIIRDRKIRTMTDFVCWIFSSISFAMCYSRASKVFTTGRQYFDFDNLVHVEKLDIENTVLLKCIPRFQEPEKYFYEKTVQQSIELQRLFDSVRICHYGDLRIRDDDYDIIPMTDVATMENGLFVPKFDVIEKYDRKELVDASRVGFDWTKEFGDKSEMDKIKNFMDLIGDFPEKA